MVRWACVWMAAVLDSTVGWGKAWSLVALVEPAVLQAHGGRMTSNRL